MLGRIVNRLEEGAIAFLLAAMTLLTFVQVVLRYVFNSGFLWALEATVYMFAWLVLIGISYGVKVGAHIGVDVAVNALPEQGRRIAGIVAGLLSSVYAVLMLVGSWNYFHTIWTVGVLAHDIPIQRWVFVIVLPIGFLLLLFRLLEMTWNVFRGEAAGFRLADEAADALKYSDEEKAPEATPHATYDPAPPGNPTRGEQGS